MSTLGPVRGQCLALFCFDVGRDLDPALAEQRLAGPGQRLAFQHRRHASAGAVESTRSLRTQLEVSPIQAGAWASEAEVGVSMHALGAIAVTWSFPFEDELGDLPALAVALADEPLLMERSRDLVARLVEDLGDAVLEPCAPSTVEDYLMFHVCSTVGEGLLEAAPEDVARLLRAELGDLSSQEVADALGAAVSYRRGEVVVVDWLGALLVGVDMQDELLLLEHANVELLQLQQLDDQLNRAVGEAHAMLATRARWRARSQAGQLERIARMQADDAVFHEGFDNPLQLLGDDYLARLYRAVSERFHFPERDAAVQRKLGVIDSIYQKLSDRSAHRRSEALEWIIILLIAFEIVFGLLGVV